MSEETETKKARTEKTHPGLIFLYPLGLLYLFLVRIRQFILSRRQSIALGKPTISVGNLTFGGTGKTPITIAIARLITKIGLRPSVVLRGYRRQTRGPRLVKPSSSWREVGDEALVIFSNLPGVPIAVAEKREEAAALVEEETDIFILDDAFQHIRVKRDLNLLLVDATKQGDLSAPPVGRLREFKVTAKRADAVIVTRGSSSELPPGLMQHIRNKPILSVQFDWSEIIVNGTKTVSCNELSGKKAVAFAGIGNPYAFFSQARENGIELLDEIALQDHAEPDKPTMESICRAAEANEADLILTTEKDSIKWLPLWSGDIPLAYPRLEALFEDGGDEMKRLIDSIVEKA